MSGKIQKIMSRVAFPLNRYNNQLVHDVYQEQGQIDMASSYLEMELTLDGVTDYHNIVLGHDGLYYNPSCLVRSAKLTEGTRTLADLMYVNMLSNNLEYWSKGKNAVVADALYDGKGHVTQTGDEVLSVFNNTYEDTPYAVVKCPLSLLFPGTIGHSDLLPQSADMQFRYLLEPSYNVFQRAVGVNAYEGQSSTISTAYAFANVANNVVLIPASALGTVANFTAGQEVIVEFVSNGVQQAVSRTVASKIADNAPTIGSITLSSTLDAVNAVTSITIKAVTANGASIKFNNLTATGSTITLTTPAVNKDLNVNTKVKLEYVLVSADGTTATVDNFVSISSIAYSSGTTISSITLSSPITCPTNGVVIHISIVPLYTNVTNNWSLKNSHMVVYRKSVPLSAPAKMLVSDFDSVNVAMVGGLNRFFYTAKAKENAYNVYVLTPNTTNLFSQRETIKDYLIYVNNVPLTSIYVDSTSAVHNDNMIRTFSNSSYYQPSSLKGYKDTEIPAEFEPSLFVGKLFQSVFKGEPHVLDMNYQDKDVKVELVAADGDVTGQKMVYVFFEKWCEV
jgi:hypothetical protein